MEVKNLLSASNHYIKKNNKLKLQYKTFPYAPFYDYKISKYNKNIIIENKSEMHFYMREGAPFIHTKYFIFPDKGYFEIYIKSMYDENNNMQIKEMEKCYTINVE